MTSPSLLLRYNSKQLYTRNTFCGTWYLSSSWHNGIPLLISIFTFWSSSTFHSVVACQILSKSLQFWILRKVWFWPHHRMAISVCTTNLTEITSSATETRSKTQIQDGGQWFRAPVTVVWPICPTPSWISECYLGPRNHRMGSMYLQTKFGANWSTSGQDTPICVF